MFGGYNGLFKTLAKDDIKPTSSKLSYIDSMKNIVNKVTHVDEETGVTSSHELRLAIVTPTTTSIPKSSDILIIKDPSVNYLSSLLSDLNGIIALDIETKGTQAAWFDNIIVGIGLANHQKILYFDLKTISDESKQYLYNFLTEYKDGFVGHNIFFDGAFLLRDTGKWLNFKFDTYGLYRQLATEGYTGQRYGLKDAQIELLNWEVRGDFELGNWLVQNGYYSDKKLNPTKGHVKFNEAYYKPNKSEMWRAPAEILGYYCGLDCASTYDLLVEVFLPSISNQAYEEVFLEYHDTYIFNVKKLAEQQLSGISIDKDKLVKYSEQLIKDIQEAKLAFLNHPKVKPFIDEYNQYEATEYLKKEPHKFKKLPEMSGEPKKLNKNGSVSKVWEHWEERRRERELLPPVVSQSWENWNTKYQKLLNNNQFNINSNDQLIWLFYECLKFPIKVQSESGKPAVSAKSLPAMGEIGQLLMKYKDLEKERTYVTACLEHLIITDGVARIHPQFKCPGTFTCRLAGSGGINLQQLPKSRGYLECWRPEPGKAWIDFDFKALEQVVLAELTRDDSLFKIYGPGVKPNDIYLYNAAHIKGLKDKVLEAGYNPDNPTTEGINNAKKVAKQQRSVSKVITLGQSYGMGPKKLRITLDLQGIEITEDTAYEMWKGYWDLYTGVKKYEKFMKQEHHRLNGYIYNGIGRPVGCADDFIKDIVNRIVQSTGHDILMMWIKIYSEMLDKEGINWTGVVIDFHDQSIIECDEEDTDKVIQIMKVDSINKLNELLDGVIPLEVSGGRVNNLADAKCE